MKDLYDTNLTSCLPTGFLNETNLIDGNSKTLISSQSCTLDIAIASNDNVVLLSDNGTTISSSIKLDCTIEVLQWSSDGKFLALGDAAGSILIISPVGTSFETVFSESLPNHQLKSNDESKESNVFLSISFIGHEGLYKFAIANSSGKVYFLDKINLTDQSDKQAQSFQKQWLLFDTLNCHEETLCCHCFYHCFYESLLFTSGYGESSVASWNISKSHQSCKNVSEHSVILKKQALCAITDSDDFVAFTKMQQVQSYIFAICNKGHLYQFSLPHFVLMKFVSDVSFTNFLIKMPKNIVTVEGRNLCKIYGVVGSQFERRVCVYSWEQMKELFSVPGGSMAGLIEAPNQIDEVFYVNGELSSSTSDKSDPKCGIMRLSQSSPEDRFHVLLQQHNYEEAVRFATKYNLDQQPLHQHQASFLLDQLNSAVNATEKMSDIFSRFKQCIAKIEDVYFVGELCVNCSAQDISIVYELLKIARDYLDSGGRLYRASVGNDTSEYADLSLEVDRLLDLLVTFRMTFASADAALWQQFQSTKLSTQVASLLAAGNLQEATMICSRHERNLISDLEKGGKKQFHALLSTIADDADVNDLVAWLELIIPAILTSSVSNSVEIIAEWLRRRALSMEDVAKDWPDDGIKIANVFFKVQRKLSTVGFVRDQLSSSFFIFNNKKEIAELKLLASRLNSLKTLRSRYKCSITLHELIQETTVTLTFRMLDKVTAPELVAKCLECTVRPYMSEHKLDEDETLLRYIKEIIGFNKKKTAVHFRSLQKRKVAAIIKCLRVDKVIVESTCILAKEAPIPWSKDMHDLVEKALETARIHFSNESLLDDEDKASYQSWFSQLSHCVNLEKIPALTAKYDIGVIPHGKLVDHQILVKRIVRDDREDALEDAETIASIFSNEPKELVYFNRIQHLISQEKISECLELLEKQPDLSIQLIYRVYSLTTVVLESTRPMWAQTRIEHCLACIAMMEHVSRRAVKLSNDLLSDWLEDLQIIKNIYNLQFRYGECITMANYQDKAFKDTLLTRYVLAYYRNRSTSQPQVLESASSDSSSFFNQSDSSHEEVGSGDQTLVKRPVSSLSSLLDLARLLEISGDAMMAEIALKAAVKCQAEAAIEISKDLYRTRPSQKTVKFLKEIALTLLRMLKENSSLVCRFIPDICELVSVVATYSEEGCLLDVATLASLSHLSRDVLRGTDLCAGDFISKCVERGGNAGGDKYEDATWLNNWYAETDVLTLQSASILPLVSHIIQLVFDNNATSLVSKQPRQPADKKLDELVNTLMKTTAYLNSSHRVTLSLQWLATIESTLTSHLSNSKSLYQSQPNTDILKRIFELKKYAYASKVELLEALLKKVFLARLSDATYIVSLLLAIPAKTGFRLLNAIYEANNRNFAKIKTVAQVAIEFARLKGNTSEMHKFESLLLDATWAQRLHSLHIAVDCLLLSSNQWKKKYLHSLLEHRNITGKVLMDFCRDYDFDCDSVLIQYVSILLSDGLQFAAPMDSIDSPEFEMLQCSQSTALVSASAQFNFAADGRKPALDIAQKQEMSWEKTKEELKWVCRNVSGKAELLVQIERCLVNYMSPYDYDKADFVLQLLLKVSNQNETEFVKKIQFYQKASRLLGYLRYVKRDQPASEVELQRKWRADVGGDISTPKLPPLAQKNLPLHPLIYGDISMAWKVLSAESNEKSIEYLVPIAKLLNLNVDKLYLTATDNVISRYKSKENTMEVTHHQFKKLKQLTEKITSKTMAVAIAKRIAEALCSGQEKVDAYKWCLSLVSNWRDSLDDSSSEYQLASNAQQTLFVYHCQASCELALTKHGCNTPDARNLMMKPDALINHLYQHPTIVARFYEPGGKYPDIHALVDEIASIHQRNEVKLRLKIIMDLLRAAGKHSQEVDPNDSTINLERVRSAALTQATTNKDDEEDLIRLLYILTYDDPDQQGKYLVGLISKHQDSRFTNACRVRALHCLFRIMTDDQKLFALTNKTADQLRADMRVLIYLTELEEANFNVPASHLRQSDKSSVAQSLIASSARQRNPVALRAAAEMCREFGSASTDMWIVLLQQLVSLKQVTYLQQLLPDICRIPAVLSLPCLPSVWQSCVTLPIVSLTPPLDQGQIDIAISSYHFLIRCPVLLKIDLKSVANYFHNVGLEVLALACLLISPSEKGNALKLAQVFYSEIREQLSDLHTECRPLPGHILIIKFLEEVQD